jgi:acyl carrier protein
MSDQSNTDVLSRILPWLQENIREQGVTVAPDTEIIAQNLLDSMDLLRLVSFLEETFGVSLDPDLLVPENFATPADIAALLERVKPTH